MRRRPHRLGSEVARFLAVGGVATLVALVLFNLLLHGLGTGLGVLGDQPLAAYLVANAVGMAVSYRGSRSWAFRHREAAGPTGGRVTYAVVNLASLAVPMTCLAFSRYVLGRSDPLSDNVAANVVGLGLGTAVRFWAVRRLVFLSPVTVRARRVRAAAAGAGPGAEEP